ncbi:MAG TPA: asparagine synthase-related protein [Pyrinomonadaceae bacterium]|nr:asparagine synthase-related protein [Pyrinomonadaceae bacterium]
MSALSGIYNFNGLAVDEELLIELGNRLNARGPDGGREVLFNSIGMSYRAFHTNQESRLERQPLVSTSRHLLTWDGRLDNRKELISELRDDLQGAHTDVAIVMAAYLRWRVDFLPRLIGDFALSLWDPHMKVLLLARDPVGPRNLYYYANNGRIIWSTELGSLLDLTGIKLEINEEYIADFLTRLPEPSQTPYKNIHAVPPGNVILLRNEQLHMRRFWVLDPKHEIRYKTDAEYEEHFRHLFREAVCCRLRVDGPVWAELSGGLDSSSIVCMADEIVKSGDAQASGFETVSLVYDEASKSDERKYIRYVEEKIGKKGLYLREDDYRILSPLPVGYTPTLPNPIANFAEYHEALDQAMREGGARILLSGKGGDEILSSARDPAPELADLLVQWRLTMLHRRLRVWSQSLKKPYLALLWQKAIVPTLPRKLRAVCSRGSESGALELYGQEFVMRMNLRERRQGPSDVFGFRCPSGRDQSIWFLRMVRELSAGYWREFVNADISYPYTHRPLVEFMQAIPFDQRVHPRQTRYLLRRALRDLLPPEIANRKGKTLNTEAALRAVAREWPRLHRTFTDASVCAYGYVNPEALLARLNQAKQGRDPNSLSIAFLIPLEYWLRSLELRNSIAANSTAAVSLPEVLTKASYPKTGRVACRN